jgi:hypothetical protein
MLKTFFVTGFQSAKGIGKASGKAYEFANLFNLSSVRNWETENGKSVSKGLTVDDDKCLKASVSLVSTLNSYEYPCLITAEIGVDPEDMTKTILVSLKGSQHVDLDKMISNSNVGKS